MVDLTPAGLSADRKHLILISDRGEEFTVPLDHRLRAALQGDQSRLGQLEMTMESTLRPRDIQSRIRGGDSAEEVAAAAQTTVDKIMPFAGPVLAERAHIAESAQASSVRRSSGEPSGARVLSESAGVYLRTLGARLEDVAWDAWRREDGRWVVIADFVAGDRPRHAEFVYDVPGRYVVADNEEALRLTGEVQSAPTPAARTTGRRLSAVPSGQDELPLGDDAIELVREDDGSDTGPGTGPDTGTDVEHTTDLGAARGQDAGADLTADHADADWITQGATDAHSANEPHEYAESDDDEPEELVDGAAPVDEPVHDDSPGTPGAADSAGPADGAEDDTARPAKRKGRSSVPSWDEIMFGGGRSGD